MEGKNAAFSRNQTGKKGKKRKGRDRGQEEGEGVGGGAFLHAVCTARYSSGARQHSGRSVSSPWKKQHDPDGKASEAAVTSRLSKSRTGRLVEKMKKTLFFMTLTFHFLFFSKTHKSFLQFRT